MHWVSGLLKFLFLFTSHVLLKKLYSMLTMPLSQGLERDEYMCSHDVNNKNLSTFSIKKADRNMFMWIKTVAFIHFTDSKKLHSWKRFWKIWWFIYRCYQKLNVFLREHLNFMLYPQSLQTISGPIGVGLTVSSIPIINCMHMCFLNSCLLTGLDAFLGLLITSI